jgi:uncharacterized protein YjdB
MHRSNSRIPRILVSAGLSSALALLLFGATGFAFVTSALSTFSLSSLTVVKGGAVSGTATISPASAAVEIVSFSSDNTAAATVPASMPIQPRSAQATVPVFGIAPGCAIISATHRGKSIARYFFVDPTPTTSTFTLTVPEQRILVLPGSHGGKVTKQQLFGTSTVNLSSSNPSIVSVPATVETVRGIASFYMTTHAQGCATITASIGTQSVGKTIRVYEVGG